MCGIFGIVNPVKENINGNLDKMLRVLRHRGPDGENIHFFKNCIFGHTRLSIIDPIGGQQPMLDKESNTGLTFNGELYGYKDIKEKINYNFQSNSDTELLLVLYKLYGLSFINILPGMFSFGLWDSKKKLLLCARDRFGEKPLYYAKGNSDEFIFASEIKAIKASGIINPIIDNNSISHYLKRLYVHPSKTIYKNIFSLPPGHYLKYQDNKIQVQQYWDTPEPTMIIDEHFAIEKFEYLFNKSIKKQMIADVPVGAFLSGGLDSSTIVAIASRYTNKLKTFSFGFNNKKNNEIKYARIVAKKYNTEHYELIEQTKDLEKILIEMQGVFDEPFADSSNIPTYLISKLASDHVKVVLSGDGGDELLAGYNFWYNDIFHLQEYLQKFDKSMKEKLSDKIKNRIYNFKMNNRGEQLYNRFKTINKLYYSQRQFFSDNDLVSFGCSPISNTPIENQLLSIDDCLRNDIKEYLSGDILVKTDRSSMANSLEVRSPFLDVDLAEFCISLPYQMKISPKVQKIILRKAFSKYWPEKINNRNKMGFGAPVHEWLKNDALKSLKNEYLGNTNRIIFSHLDGKKIKLYKSQSNYKTWILLNLSLWLEHHYRG